MRFPNKTTVIATAVGPLLWLSDHLLHDQPWWQHILSWLVAVWAAFVAGIIVEDLLTKDSWVRQNLRAFTRVFVVETVARSHRTNEQREWLEITVHVYFPRVARRITIAVSVDSATNIPHARRLFVLNSDFFDRVAKNERRTFIVAVIPLGRHDGRPQGYMCWGARYRESGDVEGIDSLSDGTDNTIIVEASTGSWVRQRERIFLTVLRDHDGRVFLARKGSPATLEVVAA